MLIRILFRKSVDIIHIEHVYQATIFDIFQDFCIFKGSILPMKGDICPIWA